MYDNVHEYEYKNNIACFNTSIFGAQLLMISHNRSFLIITFRQAS